MMAPKNTRITSFSRLYPPMITNYVWCLLLSRTVTQCHWSSFQRFTSPAASAKCGATLGNEITHSTLLHCEMFPKRSWEAGSRSNLFARTDRTHRRVTSHTSHFRTWNGTKQDTNFIYTIVKAKSDIHCNLWINSSQMRNPQSTTANLPQQLQSLPLVCIFHSDLRTS